MQSVTFSDQTRNSVSYDAVPYFFTDRYTQTVPVQIIFKHIHNKKSVCMRSSLIIYDSEIFVFFQRFWKYHYFFPNSFIDRRKGHNMWPKLSIFFFLLIFLQLILFFRLLFSFFFWIHELLIYVSFLAGMSFSYLPTSSTLKKHHFNYIKKTT